MCTLNLSGCRLKPAGATSPHTTVRAPHHSGPPSFGHPSGCHAKDFNGGGGEAPSPMCFFIGIFFCFFGASRSPLPHNLSLLGATPSNPPLSKPPFEAVVTDRSHLFRPDLSGNCLGDPSSRQPPADPAGPPSARPRQTALSQTSQNLLLSFLSRQFLFFLFSVCWWCSKRPAFKCKFRLSGCRVKSPRLHNPQETRRRNGCGPSGAGRVEKGRRGAFKGGFEGRRGLRKGRSAPPLRPSTKHPFMKGYGNLLGFDAEGRGLNPPGETPKALPEISPG